MKLILITTLFSIALITSAKATSDDKLKIKVHGLRNNKGRIIIMIDNNEKAFKTPTEKDAYGIIVLEPQNKKVIITVDPVIPSNYAITVIHDENHNGKLDTNFLGIPTEGIGFSTPVSLSEEIKFNDIAVSKKKKELVIIIGIDY